MPNVPTTNLNAYYGNTSPGNTINSGVIDPALQDIAQAINDNYELFQNLITALELPIPDQSIVTRHIRNAAITNPKYAQLSITADKIADGSITLTKLADLVVTASKIADGTITEPKYADGSVSSRAIAPGAVGYSQIDGSLLSAFPDASIRAEFDKRGINIEKYTNLVVSNDWKPAIEAAYAYGSYLLVPYGTHRIGSNMTIPEGTTVEFLPGGSFTIASGVTLTFNGSINADFNQIFVFEDNTSTISVSPTSVLTAQKTVNKRNIKLSWFGALGNAVYNSQTSVLTGTDDSTSIKRAFEYASKCSAVYPNYGTFSTVTVEATPNAQYRVSGDNILGSQITSTTGNAIAFNGNRCTFYYTPILTTDSFIGNARKTFRPEHYDFGVYVTGFSGRKGYFYNTNGGDTFNAAIQGSFRNVQINDATVLNSGSAGFDEVFHIEGNNSVDNYTIERCTFFGCNTVFRNKNKEAVNWVFDRCCIVCATDNAVAFWYDGVSYGGVDINDCEIALYNPGETLLKYVNDGFDETRAKFKITGRIEVRQQSHTLVNMNSGYVEIDGLDMTYGANFTPNANSISLKLSGKAFADVKNSVLSETMILNVVETNNLEYINTIKFDNTAFYTSNGYLSSYPNMKIESPNGVFDYSAIFSTKFTHGRVTITNPRYVHTGAGAFPIAYDCLNRSSFDAILANKYTGGKTIVPYNTYAQLPYYSVITSLKLFVQSLNLSDINSARVNVLSKAGGTVYNEIIDLTSYVSGSEILTSKRIAIQKENQMFVSFYKDGVLVSTESLMPNSWLEMKYTSMNGAREYNSGTVGSFTI